MIAERYTDSLKVDPDSGMGDSWPGFVLMGDSWPGFVLFNQIGHWTLGRLPASVGSMLLALPEASHVEA